MNKQSHIFERIPLTSGLLLGVLPLPIHVFIPIQLSYELAAITLVLIAGIYIGYAFKDGRPNTVFLEFSVALAFAATAWVGMNGYPFMIIGALVAHGFWDLLHLKLIKTDVPRWYIRFCVICDWVMAASLTLIWSFLP
ncbi:DUF6010 family protein [Sulfitobacter donghicola]|uniref:DUF3429 domain-containing protein n=1 Tax=Sulfitobacter donghicola DSW-25 = KCTC 12864 = JCM 14565 TaxID=1300350 RepID=A0A073INC3_9RHOB|nr:DUF6010 family protein [Sulfitobacter donghicola]KEJ91040.1 hypothetical protein DSW25_00290 [Sulfitobacter donghicola DSW-25 = KCTC 12864 = JCM 14565]